MVAAGGGVPDHSDKLADFLEIRRLCESYHDCAGLSDAHGRGRTGVMLFSLPCHPKIIVIFEQNKATFLITILLIKVSTAQKGL
jgi:hypothetical protein